MTKKPHIPFEPVAEGYLGSHPKMKKAYNLGWDDGHDGNYSNPFRAGSAEWWRYEDGYQEGQARFFAEESTPLSEQIALLEENNECPEPLEL